MDAPSYRDVTHGQRAKRPEKPDGPLLLRRKKGSSQRQQVDAWSVLNPGGVRMSPQEFTLAESPRMSLANFKTCDAATAELMLNR